MSATVLLVEDDDAVRELVELHLLRAGFSVRPCASAEDAWRQLAAADVVILDWMLPDLSGVAFLKRLRAQRGALPEGGGAGGPVAELPVLMLTARATEMDRVSGLEAGADDYLVKPFSAAELVARVRALLRRVTPSRRFEVGDFRVDVERARVTRAGTELDLTRREFDLIAFLAAHPGRVFSRAELLDRVWGVDFVGTERTVDQHVAQLRAHLGERVIQTVRGRGYRLADPDERR